MGRTLSYDPASVVRAARATFWDRGYADTSVPDLEAATGLNRSSLYHGFGSKRELFDAAVASYLDDVVRPALAGLNAPAPAPEALADYLGALRAAMSSPGSALATHGCLLLNSSAGELGREDALRAVVGSYHRELSAAVHRGVAAAVPGLNANAAHTLTVEITSLVIASMSLVRAAPAAALDSLDAAAARLDATVAATP